MESLETPGKLSCKLKSPQNNRRVFVLTLSANSGNSSRRGVVGARYIQCTFIPPIKNEISSPQAVVSQLMLVRKCLDLISTKLPYLNLPLAIVGSLKASIDRT